MLYSEVRKLLAKAVDLIERIEVDPEHRKVKEEEWGAVEATLWYIFSKSEKNCSLSSHLYIIKILNQSKFNQFAEPEYWELLFNDNQKLLLMNYIRGFKNTAFEHGLLIYYDEVIGQIDPIEPESIKKKIKNKLRTIFNDTRDFIQFMLSAFVTILLFLFIKDYFYDNKVLIHKFLPDETVISLITIILCIAWFSLWLLWKIIKAPFNFINRINNNYLQNIKQIKEQNDFIIQRINKDQIEKEASGFKAQLFTLRWLR